MFDAALFVCFAVAVFAMAATGERRILPVVTALCGSSLILIRIDIAIVACVGLVVSMTQLGVGRFADWRVERVALVACTVTAAGGVSVASASTLGADAWGPNLSSALLLALAVGAACRVCGMPNWASGLLVVATATLMPGGGGAVFEAGSLLGERGQSFGVGGLLAPAAFVASLAFIATSERAADAAIRWGFPFFAGGFASHLAVGARPQTTLWVVCGGLATVAGMLTARCGTGVPEYTGRTLQYDLFARLGVLSRTVITPRSKTVAERGAHRDLLETSPKSPAAALRNLGPPVALFVITGFFLRMVISKRHVLGGWDTAIFLDIAANGPRFNGIAEQPTATSFPGYPLLIRLLSGVIDDPRDAAVIISVASGMVAIVVLWCWTEMVGLGRAERVVATLLFAWYPYGFFLYGVAYSDGLFVALAISCFIAVERDRPLLAGAIGVLATATRPTGLALLAGLIVCQAERVGLLGRVVGRWREFQLRLGGRRGQNGSGGSGIDGSLFAGLKLRHAGVGIAGLGVGAYSVYCWLAFGDPIAFWTGQAWYGHGEATSLLTWSKYVYREALWAGEWPLTNYINTLVQLALTIGSVLVLPRLKERFGAGYAVYGGLIAVQTWIGDTVSSTGGRYLIANFALFALAGESLARRGSAVRVGVLATSGILMALLDHQFVVRGAAFPIW